MKENMLFDEFSDLLMKQHRYNHQQYIENGEINKTENRFGRFIRVAREKLGLTRNDLSLISGISLSDITAIEYGLLRPEDIRTQWIHNLAEALEEKPMTINLLLGKELSCNFEQPLSHSLEEQTKSSFYETTIAFIQKLSQYQVKKLLNWWENSFSAIFYSFRPVLFGLGTFVMIFLVFSQYNLFLVQTKSNGMIEINEDSTQQTQYTYDAYGTRILVADAANSAQQAQYNYDSNGNLISLTDANNEQTRFAYDGNGNLISVTDATGAQTLYVYDENGNLISVTDANNEQTRFTYDGNGNLTRGQAAQMIARTTGANGTQRQYIYDTTGNYFVEWGQQETYFYDSLGRLTYDDHQTRLLAHHANFSLATSNTYNLLNSLEMIAKSNDGVLVNTQIMQISNDIFQIYVQFDIPAKEFEAILKEVESLNANIVSQTITSEDVTIQYADLDARLRNLELTEIELQNLLTSSQERGDGAEGILSIYKELTSIREKIEQLKAQKTILENSIAMSRITITINPEQTSNFQPRQILQNSWSEFISFMQWVISGVLWVFAFSPLILSILVFVTGIRYWIKRKVTTS